MRPKKSESPKTNTANSKPPQRNVQTLRQQLPNPLMEAGWQGKGRAEKAAETSAAEVGC